MLATCSAGHARYASALLALTWISGCCVAPPRAQDLLAIGFRSPTQAFTTFQTAVRADDPGLLRRCFSSRFIGQNGLSEQVFREYWDRLRKEEPLLRKGLADATLAAEPLVHRERARLLASTHGRSLVVDLLLEDFCEAWDGDRKLADEAASFAERTGVQEGPDGNLWFYGRLPFPALLHPERITELRVGREWKIDDFGWVEEGGHGKKGGADAEEGP